jgi:hypothetical protein
MAAGADSIDDMDLLRHEAIPDLFGGIRAPSTLGSHLRSYTWGNVRQLEAVSRADARFSVTVNMDPKVAAAIATISQDAWRPIRYPRAIWDDQLRCWVSDAQVAEADQKDGISAQSL